MAFTDYPNENICDKKLHRQAVEKFFAEIEQINNPQLITKLDLSGLMLGQEDLARLFPILREKYNNLRLLELHIDSFTNLNVVNYLLHIVNNNNIQLSIKNTSQMETSPQQIASPYKIDRVRDNNDGYKIVKKIEYFSHLQAAVNYNLPLGSQEAVKDLSEDDRSKAFELLKNYLAKNRTIKKLDLTGWTLTKDEIVNILDILKGTEVRSSLEELTVSAFKGDIEKLRKYIEEYSSLKIINGLEVRLRDVPGLDADFAELKKTLEKNRYESAFRELSVRDDKAKKFIFDFEVTDERWERLSILLETNRSNLEELKIENFVSKDVIPKMVEYAKLTEKLNITTLDIIRISEFDNLEKNNKKYSELIKDLSAINLREEDVFIYDNLVINKRKFTTLSRLLKENRPNLKRLIIHFCEYTGDYQDLLEFVKDNENLIECSFPNSVKPYSEEQLGELKKALKENKYKSACKELSVKNEQVTEVRFEFEVTAERWQKLSALMKNRSHIKKLTINSYACPSELFLKYMEDNSNIEEINLVNENQFNDNDDTDSPTNYRKKVKEISVLSRIRKYLRSEYIYRHAAHITETMGPMLLVELRESKFDYRQVNLTYFALSNQQIENIVGILKEKRRSLRKLQLHVNNGLAYQLIREYAENSSLEEFSVELLAPVLNRQLLEEILAENAHNNALDILSFQVEDSDFSSVEGFEINSEIMESRFGDGHIKTERFPNLVVTPERYKPFFSLLHTNRYYLEKLTIGRFSANFDLLIKYVKGHMFLTELEVKEGLNEEQQRELEQVLAENASKMAAREFRKRQPLLPHDLLDNILFFLSHQDRRNFELALLEKGGTWAASLPARANVLYEELFIKVARDLSKAYLFKKYRDYREEYSQAEISEALRKGFVKISGNQKEINQQVEFLIKADFLGKKEFAEIPEVFSGVLAYILKTPDLKEINLSYFNIYKEKMLKLIGVLKQPRGKQISELNFSDATVSENALEELVYYSIYPEGIESVKLRELTVSGSQAYNNLYARLLNQKNALHRFKKLSEQTVEQSTQSIDLFLDLDLAFQNKVGAEFSNSQIISDKFFEYLCSILNNHKNIKKLSLKNWCFNSQQAETLFKILKENHPNLEELDLSGTNFSDFRDKLGEFVKNIESKLKILILGNIAAEDINLLDSCISNFNVITIDYISNDPQADAARIERVNKTLNIRRCLRDEKLCSPEPNQLELDIESLSIIYSELSDPKFNYSQINLSKFKLNSGKLRVILDMIKLSYPELKKLQVHMNVEEDNKELAIYSDRCNKPVSFEISRGRFGYLEVPSTSDDLKIDLINSLTDELSGILPDTKPTELASNTQPKYWTQISQATLTEILKKSFQGLVTDNPAKTHMQIDFLFAKQFHYHSEFSKIMESLESTNSRLAALINAEMEERKAAELSEDSKLDLKSKLDQYIGDSSNVMNDNPNLNNFSTNWSISLILLKKILDDKFEKSRDSDSKISTLKIVGNITEFLETKLHEYPGFDKVIESFESEIKDIFRDRIRKYKKEHPRTDITSTTATGAGVEIS